MRVAMPAPEPRLVQAHAVRRDVGTGTLRLKAVESIYDTDDQQAANIASGILEDHRGGTDVPTPESASWRKQSIGDNAHDMDSQKTHATAPPRPSRPVQLPPVVGSLRCELKDAAGDRISMASTATGSTSASIRPSFMGSVRPSGAADVNGRLPARLLGDPWEGSEDLAREDLLAFLMESTAGAIAETVLAGMLASDNWESVASGDGQALMELCQAEAASSAVAPSPASTAEQLAAPQHQAQRRSRGASLEPAALLSSSGRDVPRQLVNALITPPPTNGALSSGESKEQVRSANTALATGLGAARAHSTLCRAPSKAAKVSEAAAKVSETSGADWEKEFVRRGEMASALANFEESIMAPCP